eukprot:CAMPEP_0206429588 /NCGR_PEP_ID=MMETSP0324_2-20121206/6328_2 /ASSEMBLY_ACC=CAM_ASM_000836 /TAXON_ID=2866 /ORGANISM="Crypthecodinium cohnii, Strain Seligo" /LENGTH=246 /DNA_ID=CAMNT_0053895293 /DNA_START=288 /DNA_END=1029 /DNA_ORIENTATION=-
MNDAAQTLERPQNAEYLLNASGLRTGNFVLHLHYPSHNGASARRKRGDATGQTAGCDTSGCSHSPQLLLHNLALDRNALAGGRYLLNFDDLEAPLERDCDSATLDFDLKQAELAAGQDHDSSLCLRRYPNLRDQQLLVNVATNLLDKVLVLRGCPRWERGESQALCDLRGLRLDTSRGVGADDSPEERAPSSSRTPWRPLARQHAQMADLDGGLQNDANDASAKSLQEASDSIPSGALNRQADDIS